MTKLLIIDDDPELTRMLESLLSSKGFTICAVNSGLEGIEAVRQFEPDAILLDLMMPGLDGWQVCKNIRAFSQVPILVVSAVADAEGVMRAMDEGANDYLLKPAPLGVLISHLQNLFK